MAADFQIMEHEFDLSSARRDDKRHAFPVGPWTVASAQVVNEYNISGSYAIAFYRSIDGVNGSDPIEGAQSLAATGFTEVLDCSSYPFLIAEITTNATSGKLRVLVCVKADH